MSKKRTEHGANMAKTAQGIKYSLAANGDRIQKWIMEQSIIETKQPVSTYLAKEENGMLYPVKSTALLMIDPVNDFLSEGGAGYDLNKQSINNKH